MEFAITHRDNGKPVNHSEGQRSLLRARAALERAGGARRGTPTAGR